MAEYNSGSSSGSALPQQPANTTLPDKAELWRWSLLFYPEVKNTCLVWQDQYGLNVNLLLLLLYLQRQQLLCSSENIKLLHQSLTAQQQFTLPLRQLRRSLPADLNDQAAQQMKQALLQAELCSEQLEQQQLLATLALCTLDHAAPADPATASAPAATTVVSLTELYLQWLGAAISPILQQQIFDLDQHAIQLDFQTPKSLI
ncbi:TIGR02444 family protein [Rheinheimera sp.]|uniref:TIGR02444 family protein n=1 Tax=Rheinheimera sp. TaxID=1869214 RepID=UPI0027BA4D06|nr:TIGR02444 family protein [Rheinheimera sp.]